MSYVSNETDKKLIVLVRQHAALYDLTDPKYMDSDLKFSIWNNIGAALDADGISCKNRWTNMRDNYRKSLKKQKANGSGKCRIVKAYKYSEELAFLNPFLEDIGIETPNIEEKTEMPSIKAEVTLRDFTDDEDSKEVPAEDEENTQDSSAEVNDPLTVESPIPNTLESKPSVCAIPRKKPRLSVHEMSVPSEITSNTVTDMEHILHRKSPEVGWNKNTDSAPQSPHPVDAFLAGLAPVLKTLSPYEWHHARGEIFATVQKYELAMLMSRQQNGDPLTRFSRN